jgi:hypothetical protein
MQTVESVPYVCAAVDPVPSSRTSVATGPEPTVCIDMPQFPSPVVLPRSPSSSDSQPEVEDEYLSSEMRLYVAFEVVSHLDKAEDFRSLSPEELSLRDFLNEQIRSL